MYQRLWRKKLRNVYDSLEDIRAYCDIREIPYELNEYKSLLHSTFVLRFNDVASASVYPLLRWMDEVFGDA